MNYAYYQPTEENQKDQSIAKYWIEKRNQELAAKREDEETIKTMNEWARNKARV